MKDEFIKVLQELVDSCEGNLSKAARKSGLSVSYIHQTLKGVKPSNDPHTETWTKVYNALGRKSPATVREKHAEYDDKFSELADWLRRNSDHYPAFEALAKGWGYKKEGEE